MNAPDRDESLRNAVRDLLGELLPRTNGAGAHANGSGGSDAGAETVVPAVPAPPIAAVLRPSTWRGPAAPGEVVGERSTHSAGVADGGPAASAAGPPDAGAARSASGSGEPVRIDDDVDLNGFVRGLAERLRDPDTRDAIRAGRLRFSLRRSDAPITQTAATAQAPGAPGQSRTVTGPVTERTIKAAAADGAQLVLGPGAVLTPLARDCARSLGVKIEKERGC